VPIARDRLTPDELSLTPRELLGPRAFYTDANGCVAKAARQASEASAKARFENFNMTFLQRLADVVGVEN
jgi:hypothetical protein